MASDSEQPIMKLEESELERISRQLSERCIDGYLCESEDDEPDVLVRFDIEKILDFMHRNHWQWATGKLEPATAEVTKEDFEQQIRDLVKDSVKGTLDKYHKGEMDDSAAWGCATGGIQVRTWVEDYDYDGKMQIVTNVQFIAEDFETAVYID